MQPPVAWLKPLKKCQQKGKKSLNAPKSSIQQSQSVAVYTLEVQVDHFEHGFSSKNYFLYREFSSAFLIVLDFHAIAHALEVKSPFFKGWFTDHHYFFRVYHHPKGTTILTRWQRLPGHTPKWITTPS